MPLLDPALLKEEFNTRKSVRKNEWDNSKLTQLLRDLSQMVHDMQSAGMNIRLDMHSNPSEQVFKLFGNVGMIVPVGGVIMTGRSHHLIGICTSMNNQKCLIFSISKFDIRHQGNFATFKSDRDIAIQDSVCCDRFDIGRDSKNLVKLQQYLIEECARSALIDDCDLHGTLDGEKPQKRLLKVAPK